MKQKLTPTAKRQKALRDKKAAMTPGRRKKKAENQRKRRAAIKAGKNLYFWHKGQPIWFAILAVAIIILIGSFPILGYFLGWLQKTPNQDELFRR